MSIFEEESSIEDALETRMFCYLVFHVSIREFDEIKQKLRAHITHLSYQRVSPTKLWLTETKEGSK